MLVDYRAVTKSYSTCAGVFDINLKIPVGRVIGLIAVNGSGKTTLMKLAAGLLQPNSGSVSILGENPHTARGQVTFLSDRPSFFSWFSPHDISKYMTSLYRNFSSEKFRTLCQKFSIPSRALEKMSKGEVQKTKLAAAMAIKTPLYLLDEPLAGIDLISRTDILQMLIDSWNDRSTIVISTHEVKDVDSFLNWVIFMKKGTITHSESIQSIVKQKKSVSEFFLAEMQEGSGNPKN